MRQGELAVLTCRADYAYGETGSPPKIPPNATLNFEVELIRWSGEDISPDRDGSITRTILNEGEKVGESFSLISMPKLSAKTRSST